MTLFRCGDLFIADFLLSVTVKEFLKKWPYFVEICTRVYSLLFEPPCTSGDLGSMSFAMTRVFTKIFCSRSHVFVEEC